MRTIATAFSQNNNPGFSICPYQKTPDYIGKEPVNIYRIRPCFRLLFQKILNHLRKKHPNLIAAEEINPEETVSSTQLYPKLKEIFTLMDLGLPRRFAILCEKEEKRLSHLLETLSPFARSISFVTESASCFEQISKTAMEEYGLTVTRREITQLIGTDFTLLLSGQFDLSLLEHGKFINLSDQAVSVSIPMLSDIASKETSEFLAQNPDIHLSHFRLLPENAEIINLIWKYC